MRGLSGNLWPHHPSPLPDEVFSSWLIRTAEVNAPRLHTFCKLHWGNTQIWTRDIDVHGGKNLLQIMSEKTGTNLELARNTLIQSYEGTVFEKLNPYGTTRWVLPIGIRHRIRYKFGQQMCPLCLKEDHIPYYRKHWRLAFNSSCLRHGIILNDRCWKCNSPIIPSRNGLISCHECKSAHADAPVIMGNPLALQFEYQIHRYLHGAPTKLGMKYIHPIIYFDIVRQLCKVMSTGPRSPDLRNSINSIFHCTSNFNSSEKVFEKMDVQNRHIILSLVYTVIEGWPFKLIAASIASRNWSSWLLKDHKPGRFDLVDPSNRYLSPPPTHNTR
ncbi:TniQ family protein [Kordiimonas sp. SCSIO 12603]|uniref:TniQ family protein n=1 Tax=Kordiimonas sp. SCSIO 12603 TaxID=2829596 RepID=UPI00351CC460